MNVKHLTAEELADCLGFSEKGVWDWMERGMLPFHYFRGFPRFDMEEVVRSIRLREPNFIFKK